VRRRGRFFVPVAVATVTVALLGAPASRGEPVRGRSRTLHVPEDPRSAFFADLVRLQAARALGNRLPPAGGGDPLRPSVCVTIAMDSVQIWETAVVSLKGAAFPRAGLATCPGVCSVPLRDAALRALADHMEYLEVSGMGASAGLSPRFLILADAEIPYETVLMVLRSLAATTAGAPPGLDLAFLTGNGIRAAPVHIPPPDPLPLRAAANHMLLEVIINPGGRGYLLRAAPFYIPEPVSLAGADDLAAFLGHLHSRDPGRQTAFIAAEPRTAFKHVAHALDVVRRELPIVVLKPPGALPVRVTNR